MLSQNLLYVMREKKNLYNAGIENCESDRLDDEFLRDMSEIEKKYTHLVKHEKIRVELWAKKLGEITKNVTWKQTRNLYSDLLLKMVLKGKVADPFDKVPPEGPLPNLSKIHLKSSRSTSRSSRSILDDISNCSYLEGSYFKMHSAKKQNKYERPVSKENSRSINCMESLMRMNTQTHKKNTSSLNGKKYLKVNELLQIEPNSITDLLSPIVSNKESFNKDSFNKEDFHMRHFFGSGSDSNQITEQPGEEPCSEPEEEEIIIPRRDIQEMQNMLEESLKREEQLKIEIGQRDKKVYEFEAFFEKFAGELADLRKKNIGSLSVIRAAMKFFLSNHEMFTENREFETLFAEMMELVSKNAPQEQRPQPQTFSANSSKGRENGMRNNIIRKSDQYSKGLEEKITRSHQITHDFLAFLDEFEQRTERLRHETDLLSKSLQSKFGNK